MKLYLVCLLVALSYVSAAPAQNQNGENRIEKLFHEMLSLSKVLIKSVDKAYKEIEHEAGTKPIDKLFHEMLHIGKKLAKTFNGLAKDFEQKEANEAPRMDGKNPFVME